MVLKVLDSTSICEGATTDEPSLQTTSTAKRKQSQPAMIWALRASESQVKDAELNHSFISDVALISEGLSRITPKPLEEIFEA